MPKETRAKANPKKTPSGDKPWQFQPGNTLWSLCSAHNRKKLYESPGLLWEAACEYFKWCDEHPWVKTETTIKGDNIDVKTVPTARPYTIEGWCLYSNASRHWWNEFKAAKHHGFLEVTTRIDDIIYRQKFEGATVGTFNANIIARDLGLVDKKDSNVTLDGKVDVTIELVTAPKRDDES